ncbi:hypothetical protein [Aurantibacter aestuarii]|uniref:Uncharacterized protein n=1 Tax=Aurantibacter aestuarii TaxID=1266046 RepID=A0A2T1NA11_9FLAO|nr:hypothetical protein [Aurantibacter aestuarii]PSG88710.1 hypothetical protein C7H52_10500 [Aurantibacter aestuarii]
MSCYGQDLSRKYPDIYKEVSFIDKNKSLKKVFIKNPKFLEQSADGGLSLTGYIDNEEKVRKIEVIIYLSNGVQEYSFYLKNELLFLVSDKFKQFLWDKELNEFNYKKFDGGYSGIYVFHDKKLIDLQSLGHNRFEDDTIDIEEVFLKELNLYLGSINRQIKTE